MVADAAASYQLLGAEATENVHKPAQKRKGWLVLPGCEGVIAFILVAACLTATVSFPTDARQASAPAVMKSPPKVAPTEAAELDSAALGGEAGKPKSVQIVDKIVADFVAGLYSGPGGEEKLDAVLAPGFFLDNSGTGNGTGVWKGAAGLMEWFEFLDSRVEYTVLSVDVIPGAHANEVLYCWREVWTSRKTGMQAELTGIDEWKLSKDGKVASQKAFWGQPVLVGELLGA
mmetsp:Transcript_33892/g.79257  ORF Transcript_33892/g.79257 Transcript_33892/m.79257 type:complete len:231 (-) Transcript_33892:77-769(-)